MTRGAHRRGRSEQRASSAPRMAHATIIQQAFPDSRVLRERVMPARDGVALRAVVTDESIGKAVDSTSNRKRIDVSALGFGIQPCW